VTLQHAEAIDRVDLLLVACRRLFVDADEGDRPMAELRAPVRRLSYELFPDDQSAAMPARRAARPAGFTQ
jgi:hypothetical protein